LKILQPYYSIIFAMVITITIHTETLRENDKTKIKCYRASMISGQVDTLTKTFKLLYKLTSKVFCCAIMNTELFAMDEEPVLVPNIAFNPKL